MLTAEITLIPVSINDTIQKALNQNQVESYQFTATKAGIIRTETTFEGFVFKGVASNFQSQLFKDFIIQGGLPNFTSPEVTNQVIISNTLASKLQVKVGDALPAFFLKNSEQVSNPNQRRFLVAAIYNTGIQEFDQNYVINILRNYHSSMIHAS